MTRAMVSDCAAASYCRVPLLVMLLLFGTVPEPVKLSASPGLLRITVPPLMPMGPRGQVAIKTPPVLQVIVPGPSQMIVNAPAPELPARRLLLTVQFPVPPKSNTQALPPPASQVTLGLMTAAFA